MNATQTTNRLTHRLGDITVGAIAGYVFAAIFIAMDADERALDTLAELFLDAGDLLPTLLPVVGMLLAMAALWHVDITNPLAQLAGLAAGAMVGSAGLVLRAMLLKGWSASYAITFVLTDTPESTMYLLPMWVAAVVVGNSIVGNADAEQ